MEKHTTPSHEATLHALALWRAGWDRAKQYSPESSRADYAAAIGAVLPQLASFVTISELVAAYFASPPQIDAALQQAMYPASGRILNYGTIEDAVYWRRAEQLLAAAGDNDHFGK